ncbi:MAG TPA: DinB family protein [Thermoanaerobaculia bacterium]
MTMRWFDRSFRFDLPVSLFPAVLERLRGAPARLEEKLRAAPAPLRTRRPGDTWSAQEHAGHLLDLDELHTARLDDYRGGVKTLRPADLANRRTFEANHNARPLEEILAGFRRGRAEFVRALEEWDESRLSDTAIHPRLNQPMRLIDMAIFVADHDDHHLARMTEILKEFGR